MFNLKQASNSSKEHVIMLQYSMYILEVYSYYYKKIKEFANE